MDNQFSRPGYRDGFQYEAKSNKDTSNQMYNIEERLKPNKSPKSRQRDEDLVVEENTIYEIDRECYNRIKKRNRKMQ